MHFKSDPSDFVFVVMRWGWRINFEILLKLQKREANEAKTSEKRKGIKGI